MTQDGHELDRCAFVTAMLIQMGKVTDDDINPLLLKFQELDSDGDGMLTAEDVQLMQKLRKGKSSAQMRPSPVTTPKAEEQNDEGRAGA